MIYPASVMHGLRQLGERDRALLRHSLTRELGNNPSLFRLIEPLIPEATEAERRAVYLVAALREQLPHQHAGGPLRSFGAAVGRYAAEEQRKRRAVGVPPTIAARFDALLDADSEGVARHLSHACALLRPRGIRFSWVRLLSDLVQWDAADRPVQRAWAAQFTRLAYKGTVRHDD